MVGFAWTVTKADQGSLYVKVANPSSEDVMLHGGTPIGTFHATTDDSKDEYTVMESFVCNVNIQIRALSDPPVLPDISHPDLTGAQQDKLKDTLNSFSDVFSQQPFDFGRTNLVTHKITTTCDTPISQRAYRTSPSMKAEIRRQVEELKAQDLIEDSTSPWASPVVMVKKKDGTYRFCVDFRKLNSVTITDAHPLPRVDDSLDALSGSQFFSTMDMSSGYWQVEMHSRDRPKTAFTTGDGLYQFKVMPMGLKNSPPTFQRLMELVLRGLHWTTCVIYLDDIICIGRDFDDHLQNLTDILTRFRQAGLKLNPRKCDFCKSAVKYMGHVVSRDGLTLDPVNSHRVGELPVPRSPTEVRAFLGLCSYYRRFVHKYAFIAHPLHRLTQKHVPFEWTDECSTAFQTLKDALTSPPIMAFPNFHQPFILSTDASNYAVGAVLSQVQNGNERVIAYASHVLTRTEKKWSTYDKELWAIVWSVRHFRHYLSCNPFTIVTDHRPLLTLRKLDVTHDPTGRRGRWALELNPYQWTILHKEGKKHTNADAMSRIPLSQDTVVSKETATPSQELNSSSPVQLDTHPPAPQLNGMPVQPSSMISTTDQVCCAELDSAIVQPTNVGVEVLQHTLSGQGNDIVANQLSDPILSEVYKWVQQHKRPYLRQVKGKIQRKLWWQFPKLVLCHDMLCRKAHIAPGQPVVYQVLIPTALVTETMNILHGTPCSGHYSADRTFKKALTMCYWPSMRVDIDDFCDRCHTCEAYRKPVPQHRAPLQSIQAERPFQFVCTDITELPLTSQGHKYVLVVQDHFTKYVNAFPMSDQKATTVAQLLCERYIPEHGVPEELFSDQGRQYESEIIQTVCQRLNINKKRTSPYHPRGNGMVERFNRTLKGQLAKLIHDNGGEWDHYLPAVVLSFNSTSHSSTGYSPYFLAHGREPRVPASVTLSTPIPPQTPKNYGSELVKRLDTVFQAVHCHREEQRLKREYYFNRHVKFKPYQCGDLVWMDDPTTQRKKLDPNWTGPYKVISSDDKGVIYKLLDLRHSQAGPKVVHYDRLKPYRSSLETSSMPVKQLVPQQHMNTLPRYTSLSGSLPMYSVPLDLGQASAPACPSVPLLRRPSGRVSRVQPQQNQLPAAASTVPVGTHSGDPSTTRSGRVIQRPQRLML